MGNCAPSGANVSLEATPASSMVTSPASCTCNAGVIDCSAVSVVINSSDFTLTPTISNGGSSISGRPSSPVNIPAFISLNTIGGPFNVGDPVSITGTCAVPGSSIEVTLPSNLILSSGSSPAACKCSTAGTFDLSSSECGSVTVNTNAAGTSLNIDVSLTDPDGETASDSDTFDISLPSVDITDNLIFSPSASPQALPADMGTCSPAAANISVAASPATSMLTSPAACTCNSGVIDCSAVNVVINSNDFTLTPTLTDSASNTYTDTPANADVPAAISIDPFANDILDGDAVSLMGTCSIPGSSISLLIPSNVDLSSGSSPVACSCSASGSFDLSSTECGSMTLTANTTVGSLAVNATITDSDGDTESDLKNLEITVRDTDGDGVPDAIDVDDDNDGILDTDGQTCLAPINSNSVLPTIWWDINSNAFPGDIEDNFISPYTSSTKSVSVGSGLTFSRTGSAYILNNIDAADLTQSISNDEFIEVGFSTNSSFPTRLFVENFQNFVRGLANTGIVISNDNFTTHTTIYEGLFGAGSGWRKYPTSSFELKENENYKIRLYFYDTAAGRLFDGFGFNFSCLANFYADSDLDRIENRLDLDSDNDGISDLTESGFVYVYADSNSDGFITEPESLSWLQANIDPSITNGDSNSDGLMDLYDASVNTLLVTSTFGTDPIDTDIDTIKNYLDLDSDGDTIPDAIEARATGNYVAYPLTIDDAADSDDDGILDIYDDNNLFGSTDVLFTKQTQTTMIRPTQPLIT